MAVIKKEIQIMGTEFEHQAVLLEEAVAGLNIVPDGIYIDGTFGRGGHSQKILSLLGSQGHLLAIDKDVEAIKWADQMFGHDPRFSIVHGSFSDIAEIVAQQGWSGKVNGILLDLGVSSPQLDNADRGFSFMKDGPLDMRMNSTEGESVADWLAYAKIEDIALVLKKYGEERFAKRIAGAIAEYRVKTPILRTQQLVEIITAAQPFKEKHKHPATRSFQALRIYINHELDDLEKFMTMSVDQLASHGRISIISFHSLEDRIVKQMMNVLAQGEPLPPGLPVREVDIKRSIKIIAKKVRGSDEEIKSNPRARSAILRIAEKLG